MLQIVCFKKMLTVLFKVKNLKEKSDYIEIIKTNLIHKSLAHYQILSKLGSKRAIY